MVNMETICLVNKPHNPFQALEQQLQHLTSTTTAQHHFQQQLQQCSDPTTSAMFSKGTTTTACTLDTSRRELAVEHPKSQQHLQQTQTDSSADMGRSRNTHKRRWASTQSSRESNVVVQTCEDIANACIERTSAVPEKRVCKD
ncbi:hypothetical protein EGW08_003216, partial [Elysia chlorotica]